MPNHCENTVTFSGPREEVEKVRRYLTENYELDFDKIIPMPKALDTESGSMATFGDDLLKPGGWQKVAQFSWLQKINPNMNCLQDVKEAFDQHFGAGSADKAIELGEQRQICREQYGYPCWYDWRIANWGTKWNSYWGQLCDDAPNGEELSIRFSTPWSPPTPIFEKLAEMLPQVQITVDWEVEGDGDVFTEVWNEG